MGGCDGPARTMASRVLQQLAKRGWIEEAVAVVAAHPDDETIGAGGSMARFRDLSLISVTDGAAADVGLAQAHGFATREAYMAARRQELAAALAAARAEPMRHLSYGLLDGSVSEQFDALVERLTADLMTVDLVITHPYEGGHIDHDACARAVHAAAAALGRIGGRAPGVLEFASYYHINGGVRAGAFWPDAACPAVLSRLDDAGKRRRAAALACFTSQAGNIRYFYLDREAFRCAPVYDFSRPPPPRLPARTRGRARAG